MKHGTTSIQGQSILEIIIALGIGGILIIGAVAAISTSLQADVEGTASQTASFLTQELADNVSVFASANWRNIYDLDKSPSQYYLVEASGSFTSASGSETIVVSGTDFTRYFTLENVSRDANGAIQETYVLANDDPSTQKLEVVTTWATSNNQTATSSFTKYLARRGNVVFVQTDWVGGPTYPVVDTIPLPNNSYTEYATSTNVATSTGSISIEGL